MKVETCVMCAEPLSERARKFKHKVCSLRCRINRNRLVQQGRRDWYRLQAEVAAFTGGKILGGPRRGRYSDVESVRHLVECKLISNPKEAVVRPIWLSKVMELAELVRKWPVLVIAIGGIRGIRVAIFPVEPDIAIPEFSNVLNQWVRRGLEVWVVASTRASSEVPFLNLEGEKWTMPQS
jgi:hypothetical protein